MAAQRRPMYRLHVARAHRRLYYSRHPLIPDLGSRSQPTSGGYDKIGAGVVGSSIKVPSQH